MKTSIFQSILGLLTLIILYQSFIPLSRQMIATEHEQKKPFSKQENLAFDLGNEWNLVWHDEFNDQHLNRSKWTAEHGKLDKNNEQQVYHPDQIELKQDRLQLITSENHYSGAIHTMNKFSFLYGRVEVRARLPKGQGIFPALWMLPAQNQTWLPEIDILELLGHEPDRIWMVIHWLENDQLKSASRSYKGPDFSKDFHTFSLEWSKDELVWLIDGEERFRTNAFVPNIPMYLYLNTAIGGDWPGSPDETTIYPQVFEVDYIRIYQRTGAKS